MTVKEEHNWGALCHLGGLASMIIPFGNIVAPVVLWQMKKDVSEFVNTEGKESINFQITMTLFMIITMLAGFFFFIMSFIFAIFADFSLAMLIPFAIFPLFFIIQILIVIFCIVAAVKTNKGEHFKYPLSIRFIK